jgi:predicted negative regulator of RcsB-dependent stress response
MVGLERLARVLLDQGQPEEAMALLQGNRDIPGFEAAFAEVRGDIHAALGQNEEAVKNYQLALDSMEAGVGDRNFLELKLKAAGGVPEAADDEDGAQS